MKKNIILLFSLLSCINFYSQESKLSEIILKKDSKLWNCNQSIITNDNYELIVDKESIVKGDVTSHIYYDDSYIGEYKRVNNYYSKIIYNNKLYIARSENLLPLKTNTLFDNKLLSSQNNRMYVPLYFIQTMYSKNKEILKSKEKDFTYVNDWYERENAHYNNALIIQQSSISFGHLLEYGFWISNIIQNMNCYEIEISRDASFNYPDVSELGWDEKTTSKLPFYNYNGNKLYLKNDGDYMYLSSDNFKTVYTFCSIEKAFIDELIYFMNDKTFNLDNFSWPRHADDTCDYETKKILVAPSSSATNVNINKEMSVKENLKLRSAEATTSTVLNVMAAGTKVKVLELGKAETIDGINSNWVKVEIISGKDRNGNVIKSGTTGWCYGGYLQ